MAKDKKTKRIRFVLSPTGVFKLAYNVGEEAVLEEKQADTLIEAGYARLVGADGNMVDNAKTTDLQTQLDAEKAKSAQLQTELDAEKDANRILAEKLEAALKPAEPAKAPETPAKP